jgi:hypothetical protein
MKGREGRLLLGKPIKQKAHFEKLIMLKGVFLGPSKRCGDFYPHLTAVGSTLLFLDITSWENKRLANSRHAILKHSSRLQWLRLRHLALL